jgi:DNA polymerase-1
VGTYLLLDGHSLAYRAWFALAETQMATASGQETAAVYGFITMTTRLLNDHHPEGMAVAFDLRKPTFRDSIAVDYKAGRTAAPDTFHAQVELIRQYVRHLGVPVIETEGYEADDVIATLATELAAGGDDVIIVTGDRDAYQLVEDPRVKVLYNRRGVTDYVLYDEAGIAERTGVTPKLYPVYASLRGDNSDNLPGVPGVGEKTAAKLVNQYGDLDTLFSHLPDLSPKLRQSLADSEPQVRINLAVIPLVRDVPLEVAVPEDLRLGKPDIDALRQLFALLEVRAAGDRLFEALDSLRAAASGLGVPAAAEAAAGATLDLDALFETIARPSTAVEAAAAVGAATELASPVVVEPEWSGAAGRSALAGLAVLSPRTGSGTGGGSGNGSGEAGAACVGGAGGAEGAGDEDEWDALYLDGSLVEAPEVVEQLGRLLGAAGPGYVAHRSKELMRWLATAYGIDAAGLDLDTALAAYLADPSAGQESLEAVAGRHGVSVSDARSDGEPAPPQLALDFDDADSPALREPAVVRAATVAALAPRMRAVLEERGAGELYREIERPLVRVLARMEVAGIAVDFEALQEISNELTKTAAELEAEVQELAGEPFKVNSTPQLRTILFDKLKLAPSRKTKTGYSTDATALEKLRGEHPIIDTLLRFREVEKLRSTYGEGLLAEVAPDGRIHASFNQTVARTGRLSSDQPNLHNIPVRTEEGRRIRAVFIAPPGSSLCVADYNQIELRVIAHLSGDPGLVEAFTSGVDIHSATASRVFGVEPSDVTVAQRSKAKMISYGLAYGLQSFGLSQRLGVSIGEAEEILNSYFEAFPAVDAYMKRTVVEARIKGYTETLFGRRRLIPDLDAANFRVRQAAERQAMNAGIQGLAADIFKVALVRLDEALEAGGFRSRIVLQVHDEVIVEVPDDERDSLGELAAEVMCSAAQLDVPLEVNQAWGHSWAEAKS